MGIEAEEVEWQEQVAMREEEIARLRERLKRANDGACDQCGTNDYEDMVCDKCLKLERLRTEDAERRADEMHDEWQGACKAANEATKARQATERKLEAVENWLRKNLIDYVLTQDEDVEIDERLYSGFRAALESS